MNSLAPGGCDRISKIIIFKLLIQNSSMGTCCEIALSWMPQNLTNEKSTLVQVMALCHQANLDPNFCHHMVLLGHNELSYHYERFGFFFSTISVTLVMMTSSNGNIFHVTDHLCWEFTSHQWIPSTKASDVELWCFLWSAPEQLSKHSWGWWFDTPWCSLWRHCNVWSLWNSFEHQVPIDEIYGCLVFKWIAVIWLKVRAPG